MKLYEVLLRRVGLWVDETTQPSTASKTPQTTKPQEQLIYNPIGSKVGGVVKLDTIDWRDYRFSVKSIEELSVKDVKSIEELSVKDVKSIEELSVKDVKSIEELSVKDVKMTDYILLARPIGLPDVEVRLRVVPNSDSKSRLTHRAVALSLYDSLAYDEGLHDVVRDKTKKFVIDCDDDPNNVTHEEYWRVNDVQQTYVATIKSLEDSNKDGVVDKSEIQKKNVDFWDYSRLAEVDGVELEEFVFVQMNKEDGWFEIYRGLEVIPERIEVF